jgi:hypothetical protein
MTDLRPAGFGKAIANVMLGAGCHGSRVNEAVTLNALNHDSCHGRSQHRIFTTLFSYSSPNLQFCMNKSSVTGILLKQPMNVYYSSYTYLIKSETLIRSLFPHN